MLFDEGLSHRAAHHAARDQAVGGRRGAERSRSPHPKALQHGAKRACGAVTAYHRDRARAQAHQRRDAQHFGKPDGYKVLPHDEADDQHQKHDHLRAAAPQHLEVGLKAHRREEEDHADFF